MICLPHLPPSAKSRHSSLDSDGGDHLASTLHGHGHVCGSTPHGGGVLMGLYHDRPAFARPSRLHLLLRVALVLFLCPSSAGHGPDTMPRQCIAYRDELEEGRAFVNNISLP